MVDFAVNSDGVLEVPLFTLLVEENFEEVFAYAAFVVDVVAGGAAGCTHETIVTGPSTA